MNFEKALTWVGFGGIRIEDDVLVTQNDPDVLSAAIPKQLHEIEALVGTGASPASR